MSESWGWNVYLQLECVSKSWNVSRVGMEVSPVCVYVRFVLREMCLVRRQCKRISAFYFVEEISEAVREMRMNRPWGVEM